MRTRIIAAALLAAIATASLAGCTSSGGSTASTSGGGAYSAADTGAGSAAGAAEPAAASAGKAAATDRSVVTTGTLRLVADSPVRTADRITGLVDAAGGHIARSSEEPGDRASADLTVRIPSAAFQRTLAAIEKEGDSVRNVSVSATDVTAQVTDYGVRIANLRTSIARLQQLLSKATSNTDLVQLESSLTDRQGSLEQLLAQQRELADQVTYATLSISIVVPAAAPKAGPADFLGGLVTGTQALAQTAAALAVAVGVALPWLLVLAVLGTIAAAIVRTVRRRTRPTSA